MRILRWEIRSAGNDILEAVSALKAIKAGSKAVVLLQTAMAAVAASEEPMRGVQSSGVCIVAASVALKAPKAPRAPAWHSALFGKSRHP